MQPNPPKILFGRMHFEDGVRTVLMWRGSKYFHAFFQDANEILRRYVLFKEMKYFSEWSNIDTNPKQIKRYLRIFLGKTRYTGLPRQMTKATKATLKSSLELLK